MRVYYVLYNNNEHYEDYQEWVGDFGYLQKEKCETELHDNGFEFYESNPYQIGHCIEVWRKLILPERKSTFGKERILPPLYESAELCVLEVTE